MLVPKGFTLDSGSHSLALDYSTRLPLSFAQQRLWFLTQMQGISEAYHISFGLRMRGSLNHAVLSRALDRILARHEALRTTFVFVGEEPVQQIAAAESNHFILIEQDLSHHEDPVVELQRIITLEASSSFDLEHGPLIRGRLVRLSKNEHALLLTMHHIVSDGWSMSILIDELSMLYSAFLRGEADPLPELEIQYADYAIWQRQWIEGDILQQQSAYWKTTLAGAPQLLDLPTDHPRPAEQQFAGAFAELVLNKALSAQLKALSKKYEATLYMTMLTGWALLLAKLSGQQDIVIGSPTANRGRLEVEKLIGFFVNTLTLRLDLSGSPSVGELLARVRMQALAAQQHQDIPFEQVVELAQPVRSLSYNPLFQVLFAWQNAATGSLELPGLQLSSLPSSSQRVSKFDLTLSLREADDTIVGGIEYATSLFEPATIRRYLDYFRILLEAMVSDETQTIDHISILPAAERQQILYEWNATDTVFPKDKCVHQLFEQQVDQTPDAVAVVYEDQQLSYRELNLRANQLAHHLRDLGVKPDDRVAICVERSFEMIIGLLAVLKAGGAYVPLDPSYPIDRLNFMLQDTAPVALLTQSHLQLFANTDVSAFPVLDLSAGDLPWKFSPITNPDLHSIGLSPHHLAYVIYTSGSTGLPKGVMVQHLGLTNHIAWQSSTFGFTQSDRVLQRTSFSFDASVWELWTTLASGACLILPPVNIQTNPEALATFVNNNRTTLAQFAPTLFKALAVHLSQLALGNARYIFCGGEQLTIDTLSKCDSLLGGTLVNLYGPTEATIDATWHEFSINQDLGTIPIGKPIANTRIYILDVYGEPVPIGVTGELYIGGAGVARGYLNRPELTAEKFLLDPFVMEPGARMYRTGDLGRWLVDGNIEFVGRNDLQVKIRGFRIELGEIETSLSDYDGIRNAVVIVREDTTGDKRLVAYYSSVAPGTAIGAEQLRSHLLARLPEYMVPAAYVYLEAMPLTPNGKLDRKALPAPEHDAYATHGYEPPRGDTEQRLAAIWADVLKLDHIGRHDNFFSLGGHSLLAITVIERMRRIGFNLDVRSIFIAPTLAELAGTLTDASVIVVPPLGIPFNCEVITPEMLPLVTLTAAEIETVATTVTGGVGNIQDIYPLAPLQEGILFHHLMAERGDPYLLEMVLGFDNRTRIDKYIKALQAVINRHDILRTAVLWEGLSEPVQVVHRDATLQVEEVALSPLSGDIAEQLHAHFSPRQFRIDIRQAPLLRVAIAYDKPNDRWLLMLLLHHLAGDHTTLDVMQQEIGAHLSGLQSTLPEPLPFRNLVAQARLGVSQEEHEAFFRNMLADVDEPTAPFGLLDVQGDGSGIEQARLTLDPALAQRLRANARRLEVSVASLCHLAWARVLSKISGRADVVFGTVLFGRMHGGAGADRIMGLFINTLPLRISINKNGVRASVQKTHTLLTDLLHHEHASLTLAQRCSSVPAPTPLFSSLFNYRHSPQATAISNNATIQAWQGISSIRSEERTNYPITVSVNDLGNGFSLDAQSPASIHPMRICEYMRTTLTSLVEALEVDPDKSLHTLDVLPAAERQQILYEWNATDTVFPKDKCVHQLFEQQVDQTPDAVAVVYEDQQLSYRELNLRANQLAHHLRDLGVKPDDRVAICVERSFEMIIGLLAVLKAGGAYVPLDPSYPIDRLNFMLQDTAPVALLTQSHLQLFANTDVSAFPVLDLSAGDLPWKFSPTTNPDLHSIGLSPHHLAYVIYTSGSTGLPKGVMVQHANIVRLFTATDHWFHFDADDVWSFSHSFAFDFSTWEIWGALLYGARLLVVSKDNVLSPAEFYHVLCQHNVTILSQTPSAFRQLIAAQSHSSELNQLRYVVLGGEALELTSLMPWYRQNQRRQPNLVNMYGITETTVHVTYCPLEQSDAEMTGRLPIGSRLPDLRIYILDVYGEPVPIGVTGELYIGGAGVARGYLNRPELTAEKFLLDPFVMEPGARMYRTGDLGRWLVDGNIEFVGRNDLQVKIRGFRIELGEIETSLSDYDGIRNAVVIVREDTTGDKRLVAYYSSVAPGTAIGAEQLRAYLLARLPEYMVPAAYVYLEAMPLTPNGKLDRKALPAPEHDAYATHGYEPPRGDTEQRLAAIWAEVLKLDRIGRHDNFFSLGGHSLLAVQVTSRLRQGFRVEVAVRDLFIHTALADLATFIESATRMDLPSSIVPCARSGRLPLSFAQQRLWFLAQMQGISEAYHISFGLRVHGSLNHAVLRRALDRVLARHEALRTTFVFVGEEPVQQIAAAESDHFILIEQDLSHHEDPVVELQRIITLEASSSFDLEHGPLIRGRLVRLSKNEHALLLTMHHIVSDGWSMSILIDELSMLYSAFLRGEADPLPELEIQYADYAIWQRQWIEGDILQQQSAYWKTTLAGAPQLLDLPTDHPRPAEQQFAGAFAELVLNKALSAQLKALSKKYEATLYMTMLTGWALLLAKLSGQQDIVIGSPTANRGRLEVEKLIGFFVNTLTLRLDLSGSPSVGELLARVRMQALAAQQHQDIPFEQVVELAQPVRSLSYNPLFQVLFAWQNAATGSLELPGLQLSSLPSSSQRVSKFDLTLFLREADDTIVGGIEYATSLFEPATIRRYLDYFRILLEAMVSDETQTIDHISILPAAERQQILYEWNATDTVFPKDKCVHQLFEQQVDQTPDAVAVVYEDQQLSYRELNLRANQLAHHLRDLGVKPDDRVAICVERSFEMIIGLLAVLKAGGAYVPLDPSYPIDRLNFMLQDTAPVALLTQSHLRLFANTDVSAFPILDLSAGDLPWKFSPITNPDLHSIGLSPHHLAYVIYTSGSTGLPKGVMVQHLGLMNYLSWALTQYAVTNDSVVSSALAFDATITTLYIPLLCGSRALLLPEEEGVETLLTQFKANQYSNLFKLTPTHLDIIGERLRDKNNRFCTNQVVIGGESLLPSTVNLWHDIQPDTSLINEYGPTECVVGCMVYVIPADATLLEHIPIGKPIANTRIYILDVYGEPVPIGVTGELYIGGAGVARGYLNRPELTAEKFLLDPFVMEPGARMYRTGDLGRWLVDGNIEFVGRNDLQVKIRGFRIELGEIETSLSDYDGIRNAVVIVREDTTGDKRLVAYYSSVAPGTAIGAEQLRAYLLARLPEYMVPAAYVYLEAMPLTPNGKLDRKALPAPEHDAYATHGYEPPRGDTEQRLAAIWADVLKLDHIGRHDNFFSLGGHSLLAITVIERMRRIGFNLDVRSIFIAPTLAELAGTLTDASVIVVPPLGIPFNCEVITPEMLPLVTLTAAEIETVATTVTGGVGNIQDIYPLAPLQEGILFHHLMAERGDPYLLEMVLGFDNRTRIDKYIKALQAVINRHDILRTAVLWEGLSEPVQVVHRNATLQVEEVALSPLSGDIAEQLHAHFSPRQFRIDIRQAPLLRVAIAYDKPNDRWLLMLLLHHLAGDHTTLDVMQQEIGAHLSGLQSTLPEPLPFRNLVAQARLGVSQEEHEAFFRNMLADVDEPTAPFGLLDVQGDGSGIEQARLTLDPALAQRLRANARRLEVSVASLCHLAWARVLSKISGRADVVFGTVLFGRMHGGAGADRIMGLFINTLPLRISINKNGVRASVQKTHTLLTDLLHHEHASLTLAQRCSSVPAPTPLFSSLFNYRHSPQATAISNNATIQAWQGISSIRSEERTNYPITVSVNDLGNGFSLDAQSPASIHPMRICEYMRTTLTSLVEALEVDPDKSLHTLDVLPAAERQQILYEWNATDTAFPKDKCVHQLFEQQVDQTPDAVAVVYEDQQLSYRELNLRANQLAHHLRDLGVKPDDRVAICVERSFEMIIGLLAVLKAGGAYVPLDPSYPIDRLNFMLQDTAPVALLTQSHLQLFANTDVSAFPVLDLSAGDLPWKFSPITNPDLHSIGLSPHHLAYVIYTSGSTGLPKGVMVQHLGLMNSTLTRIAMYRRCDRFLLLSSISFDSSIAGVFGTLTDGGTLFVALELTHHDPSELYRYIQQNIIDSILCVPSLYLSLLICSLNHPAKSCLQRVILAGEICSPQLLTSSLHRQPQVAVFNEYGPTECTVWATRQACTQTFQERVPIGKPIANTRIYILDVYGEPVPIGVTGELYIGGAGVARGYLNRPELTAEKFLLDPFVMEPGARMYRTGDLGRWLVDGNIEFVGRNDLQVKIRGFRIELGEIETSLSDYDGIRNAVVIVREDTTGDKRLVAYYSSVAPGTAIGAEQLRAYLLARLPEYMVPAAYVYLEAMPLTPNGKLDRKALPAPEHDAYATHGYEPPRGDTEQRLAAIWAEVLKLDRIGRHDNFFSLGGHSLLAVQVTSRLRQGFRVEVAVRDLFIHTALADLATFIESATRMDLPSSIVPCARSGRLPLSFAQQRLWFLAQMQGISEAYHISFGLRVHGSLNHAVLRRALDRVLARHEALRTTFVFVGEEPVQQIAAAESDHFILIEQDLSHHEDPVVELQRIITLEASSSFDLEHGPLIRGRLVRLSKDEHALLLTMHHIVSDGWSMSILIDELSMLYSAFLRGEADPLPELEIQYADYAIWQRQWIEGDILQQQSAYWKTTLAGAPQLLDLPTDHPRPAEQQFAGAFAELVLNKALSAQLKALSKKYEATLYMTMLTGWALLLAKLSGQQDIVIGSPTANRGRLEVEKLIGFFVNTLTLRLDLSGSPSVGELLARVRMQALAAQQHQDIPFEQVVELAQPVRSLSYNPLFQVLFAWQNAATGSLELPGLQLSSLPSSSQRVSKFDLTLSLREADDTIVGGIEYATSLFEPATIRRYLDYFRILLEAMVSDETQTIDHISILPAAERQQILYEWNATDTVFPKDKCVHQLFEQQVDQTPDAVAVVYEDQQLSYRELNLRANQLAHHLRDLGVKPDDRVAICVERSFEMIIGLLAVLKAGGAYVPLDPSYPIDRLNFMLQDTAPVALLTQSHLRLFANTDVSAFPILDLSAGDLPWKFSPITNPDLHSIGLSPHHLAYVIYTSGSTGLPKGVMVQHANIVRLFTATDHWFHFDADDVWSFSHSFAFDFSTWEIWGALLYGARLLVVSKDNVLSPAEFYHVLCQHNVTILSQTPSAFRQLIAAQSHSSELNQLRYVVLGGEALELTSLMPWYRQNQRRQPNLVNMYGITETTVHVTYCPLEQSDAEMTGRLPIGSRLPDLRIYILDVYGEPVPIGVTGELYIGGAGVARGYLNRPELTAEKFLLDPFVMEPGARMYRTGDLGRWLVDGNIEFVGRNDLQVKIRGFRIELGEIETSLSDYDGIRNAVVIVREDTTGDKRLVAYYSSIAPGTAIGAEQLRSHLLARLPEYMVPAAYVYLEAMPLTPNGKLDRKALPAPEHDAYATHGYEPPRGDTEQRLAAIWADVLKLEHIGRHDNFFSLGGHSLLAITVIERMRRIGFNLDVRSIFIAPTLAELAGTLTDASVIVVPPLGIPFNCEVITPEMLPLVALTAAEIETVATTVTGGVGNIQDIYPLAPLQEGILFHHLMAERGDPYLLEMVLGFDNRTRIDKYIKALQAVINRHDILRTAVLWEGLSEPVQVVHRNATLQVEEVALSPLSGDIAEQLHAHFSPRQFRIDIRQAPLLRVAIAYDKPNDRWLLMLLLHHLAGDHTTLDVMQQEIGAHLSGLQSTLPEPLPFRNLVAQARLGVSQEEHEAFFRNMLADVDEPTAPFGLLDVQGDGSGIEQARLTLDPALAQRLRANARRLEVSVASLCHLAWARVLSKISGRADVVFGTVLFGRMHGGAGADRIMGLFINTLPLRISINKNGVRASVQKTHTLLTDLLHHEHASLTLAQRCSSVPAPTPLFSSLFNYRHSPQATAISNNATIQAWQGISSIRSEERTNYPITVSVNDLGNGFSLDAQSSASIHPMRICEYMRTTLTSLVEALEVDPDKSLHTLDVLPAAERQQILYEWNATDTVFPKDKCVHQLFEQQVDQTPDAVAVVYEDQQLSYRELNLRANQLAHHLRDLGVKPDDRVAICVERSFEMIIGLLAVLKAGGAYVPLDPSYPIDRLNFMLQDTAPVALLTQSHLRLFANTDVSAFPILDLSAGDLPWKFSPITNPDLHSIGLSPHHLAYVIYTSGSTGLPKGVMVQHLGLMNYLSWALTQYAVTNDSVVSSALAFDATITTLYIPLLCGSRALLLPEEEGAETLLTQFKANQYSNLFKLTPTHLDIIGKRLRDENSRFCTNQVVIGGESLLPSTVNLWHDIQPDTSLINEYGPTECVVGCMVYVIPADATLLEHIPIGKPIANTRIYILDVYGEPVPIGVTGELYIGGAGVARGYLNRPELTAEKFLLDPFVMEPGARMYRTGDLGRWLVDGNIEFVGRNDLQVKIRGFRIELGEIETSLSDYDGIRNAVVIVREDTTGDKRLVAYYSSVAPGTAIGAEQLRAYLLARLPEYMVPAAYVYLEAIPLTPNGKLDRKALPAPEHDAYATHGYEPPRGDTEQRLAAIWAEVLKLEHIGRHDNFFELGGNSLLAITVTTLLNRSSIRLSLSQLFRWPTIESQAQQIERPQMIRANSEPILIRQGLSQTILFMFHEGTGDILHIHHLALHISHNITIYALPPQSALTVEGLAQKMTTLIRSVQKSGPYHLAGWSFGGVLAYEVANQLLGLDQTIAFLGLLDTGYPRGLNTIPRKALNNKELLFLLLESTNPNEQAMDVILTLHSTDNDLPFPMLVEISRDLLLLPKHLVEADADAIEFWLTQNEAFTLAYIDYLAHPLPIRLDLFATQGHINPSLGWDAVVPEHLLHILPISGTHHSMLTPPHIQRVGARLSTALSHLTTPVPVTTETPHTSYTPSLILVSSPPNVGPPLFCIPGAGGSVSGFIHLVPHLTHFGHIYGLQPRGLEGELVPHTTVEAASDFYIKEIRRLATYRPIHLLGHSYGGWVAYEIATRLIDSGLEVGSLTLLDSRVPDTTRAKLSEFTHVDAIMKWIEVIQMTVAHSFDLDRTTVESQTAELQLALLHGLLVQEGLISRRSKPDVLRGALRTFASCLRTVYTPSQRYLGSMSLVLVDNELLNYDDNVQQLNDTRRGWELWAPLLTTMRAPGNHVTILSPRHVSALATLLISASDINLPIA